MQSTAAVEVGHICESCLLHSGSHHVEVERGVAAFWVCDSCVISRRAMARLARRRRRA